MKFVEQIRVERGLSYRFFAEMVDVTVQAVRLWCGVTDSKHPHTRMDIKTLCKIRKLSGKNWNAFGKILDAEFLDE